MNELQTSQRPLTSGHQTPIRSDFCSEFEDVLQVPAHTNVTDELRTRDKLVQLEHHV